MTRKHLDPLLDISQEPFKVADVDAVADADAMRGPPTEPPGGGGGGGGGGGKPPDSPGGGGGGGGKPDGAGSKKGDLYGDQWVLLRDLGLTDEDGEGNGDPVLDTNGNPILVGSDELPIYLTDDDGDGKYEVPADRLEFVQEVELERANVARAPAKVMEKALLAAIEKIENADIIDADPAGRIMYSNDSGDTYATVDAPLENLALYQALMTAGDSGSWPEVQSDWSNIEVGDQTFDLSMLSTGLPDWDPSSLLGAAFSKETPISLDAVLYENTVLGVNVVRTDGPVDYFDFNDGAVETYHYDREAQYPTNPEEARWLRWVVDDGGTPKYEYATVNAAVFGGEEWVDEYLAIDDKDNDNPLDDDFYLDDASSSGVNDFAQAADDSRAVINFMHTYQAVEVDESEVPDEFMADALLS